MSLLLRIPYSMLRPIYEKTSFHNSVIEDIVDADMKPAYSHCRAITRFYAKTFYMATRFLPNEKQRSIFAIYGMCRYLDNLVDEMEDLSTSKEINLKDIDEKLDIFKENLEAIYKGHKSKDPILLAFSDTLKKYDIPIDLPFLLIEGVRTDLEKNRYNNFDELYDYSYKVASVVGLMTSKVFGYTNERAVEYAIDLGIAMQLTNIIRDIGEDLDRNRIYLPSNELRMFGISEQELFNKERSENFVELMKFQIKRARDYYEKADHGIPMLDKDSRLPVYLARYNYSKILDKIEENEFDVFGKRAFLSKFEKLSILPSIFIKMRPASSAFSGGE